jgi:GNAT superfamily N-acetyltransferase
VSAIEVRPLRRSDRDQLTDLVNAHAQAVVPGVRASVNTVLSQLEREPGEFITDPWVSERVTLVAEQRNRIAAAAHLLRYHADERAGESYRDLGELRWFLFWPQAPAGNPHWSDATDAAAELMAASLRQFDQWGVSSQGADGDLPVIGVYGVPAQWPHVRALYAKTGFVHDGHTEIVYLATVGALPRPASPPIAGVRAVRSVGINGTRISAQLDGAAAGYIEVEIDSDTDRHPRHSGWADIGNLHVLPAYQRRGVATWLIGQVADWLTLAHVDRLLDYARADGIDQGGQEDSGVYRAFLAKVGFTELTRTERGWTRTPA